MSYSMHAPIYEQLQNTVEVAGFVPEIIKECYLINKATVNKYPFCIVVDDVVGSTVKHSDQLLKALLVVATNQAMRMLLASTLHAAGSR
jgi:hypothetical protein